MFGMCGMRKKMKNDARIEESSSNFQKFNFDPSSFASSAISGILAFDLNFKVRG